MISMFIQTSEWDKQRLKKAHNQDIKTLSLITQLLLETSFFLQVNQVVRYIGSWKEDNQRSHLALNSSSYETAALTKQTNKQKKQATQS